MVFTTTDGVPAAVLIAADRSRAAIHAPIILRYLEDHRTARLRNAVCVYQRDYQRLRQRDENGARLIVAGDYTNLRLYGRDAGDTGVRRPIVLRLLVIPVPKTRSILRRHQNPGRILKPLSDKCPARKDRKVYLYPKRPRWTGGEVARVGQVRTVMPLLDGAVRRRSTVMPEGARSVGLQTSIPLEGSIHREIPSMMKYFRSEASAKLASPPLLRRRASPFEARSSVIFFYKA